MKTLLTCAILFTSSSIFAETWFCLSENFEGKEVPVIFEKFNKDTYLWKEEDGDIPLQVLQDTKRYLTLAVAIDQISFTAHIDKVENYLEMSQITLFVERPLDKMKGYCVSE